MKLLQAIGIFCLLTVSLLITACGGAGGGGKSSSGTTACGAGINLATLDWCGKSSNGTTATTISIISGASSACTSAFFPDSVTILAGETVTWKNNDTMAHTITSTSDAGPTCTAGGGSTTGSPLNSGNIAPAGTFSHTFDTTGTYYYVCAISGHLMRGTVIVE